MRRGRACYQFVCVVCGECYHAKYQGHDLNKRPRCLFCEKKPPQAGDAG